jgi:hypothetical protein
LTIFFTTAPLLINAAPMKPFILKIDVFDFTLGVVLSQHGEDNLLHHIDFHSCKFFLAKINYKIHDKELFAIVDVFEEWCHLLEEVQHETITFSNHKNL